MTTPLQSFVKLPIPYTMVVLQSSWIRFVFFRGEDAVDKADGDDEAAGVANGVTEEADVKEFRFCTVAGGKIAGGVAVDEADGDNEADGVDDEADNKEFRFCTVAGGKIV